MRRPSPEPIALLCVFAALFCFAAAGSPDTRKAEDADAPRLVRTEGGHGTSTSLGGGLYLTAHHVVAGGNSFTLEMGKRKAPAVVEREMPNYDLALVRAALDTPAIPLSCADVAVGTRIHADGYPWNDEFGHARTHGTVAQSAKWDATIDIAYRGRSFRRAIQRLDLAIAPGMSGGPVRNDRGQLVGITLALYNASLSMMVPAAAICEALG